MACLALVQVVWSVRELRCISLPGNGLIAWVGRDWVLRILAADSRKKKLIRTLAQIGILEHFTRRFDGSVVLEGNPLDLDRLIRMLPAGVKTAIPVAVFVNSGRSPQRIYVWLQSDKGNFFLKIGTALSGAAFRNEYTIASNVSVQAGISLTRPIDLIETDGLFMLLSQGIPPEILSGRSRMNSHQIFYYLCARGVSARGPFGGAVHCDLTGNNVFANGDGILVADWEFAALSGPDYCDLVGLAVDISAKRSTLASIEETLNFLRSAADIDLNREHVIACLEFLADRGNPRVQAIIGYGNKQATVPDGSSA